MRDGCVALKDSCNKCGSNEWFCIDENNIYKQFCANCGNYIEIIKNDFLNNFACPKCNCFEGNIEENNNFLAIRCKNCGKQIIVLEKHTTENRRSNSSSTNNITPQVNTTNIPKCPTCGSTKIEKISASAKLGGAMMFGVLSKTAKSQFKCKSCGYKW